MNLLTRFVEALESTGMEVLTAQETASRDYLGLVTVSAAVEIEDNGFDSEVTFYVREDGVDVAWVSIPASECVDDHHQALLERVSRVRHGLGSTAESWTVLPSEHEENSIPALTERAATAFATAAKTPIDT